MKTYKKNLVVINNQVFGYDTHIATIEETNLIVLGYWSKTSQKHVNFIAKELNLNIVKSTNYTHNKI